MTHWNQTQVTDDELDDPDLSLRLSEGLREGQGGEIRTVTSQADAGIYRWVSTACLRSNLLLFCTSIVIISCIYQA